MVMVGHDSTQQQGPDELQHSAQLSVQRAVPPLKPSGYELRKFLGAGTYGEVWVGVDCNTGRQVAIKFFHRRASVDVASLAREVEKLVFLSTDRYVVQLLDVGWNSDPPYYVMDYIERGSLEDMLRRERRLPVSTAYELFREIAVGLTHLHNRGVLHCDLKPANVLLDDDHKPRLADFGQARLASEASPALGTLFYMAPEQADLNAVADARWDVYALGAIMHCMLVGQPPYRNPESISEVESTTDLEERLSVYRQGIERAHRPQAHRQVRGVDRSLADIIDRCLSIDPAERFQSPGEVLEALRIREQSRAARPLLLAGLVVPTLLLLIMATSGWWMIRQSQAETEEALAQKAIEGNGWAAQFAARSAGDRIDQFLSAVAHAAQEPKLMGALEDWHRATDEWTEVKRALDSPLNNESTSAEIETLRTRLMQSEVRGPIQRWVSEVMTRPDFPEVASWFVCDARGVQVAGVFSKEPLHPTIARCYAYRTYFHGGPVDLVSLEGSKTYGVGGWESPRTHINQPHVSAIFSSEATETWKIAFSAPIFEEGEFLGIVAATVDMGDFIEFEHREDLFVMLVDGREGPDLGTVVEHPLHEKWIRSSGRLPAEVREMKVPRAWFEGEVTRTDGRLALLSERQGANQRWLVSRRDVLRHRDALDHRSMSEMIPTGLYVFALEEVSRLQGPVNELTTQATTLGALTLVFATLLMIGTWLLLSRAVRESRSSIVESRSTRVDGAAFEAATMESNDRTLTLRT